MTGGIRGFDDYRFWLVMLLYTLSIPLFFEGGLDWDSFHVLMPAVISFIVVTTVAWDFRVIGSPRYLPCLLAHVAFFVSMIFMLNRIMVLGDMPLPRTGIPMVSGVLTDAVRSLPLVRDLFQVFNLVLRSLGFAVIMLLVSFAVIFSRRIALSLLAIFGLVVVAFSVGQNLAPSLWSLFAGLACQVAAFLLQREDERKNAFWNRVAARLRSSPPRLAIDMTLQTALLRRLQDHGSLNEREIRGIAAGVLGCDSNDPRLRDVCLRLLDQLIAQEGMAEARDGNQGKRLVLLLEDEPPDFFTSSARTMRVICTLGFCLLYILSPIDLIPDATPVFGVVDDMVIGVVGMLSTFRTVTSFERGERRLERLPFD